MMKYLLPALLALSACAQPPGAIAPVPMGNTYDHVTCAHARKLLAEEQPKLADLTHKQTGAMIGDAIGVALVLVPTSTVMGGNVAGELGASKGRVEALQGRLLSCP